MNASRVFSLTVNDHADFLNDRFSGTGQMSLSQTLSKILPKEVAVLNVDANLEKMISWQILNQKRSTILNALAKEMHFVWQTIDYRILISSNALDSSTKKVLAQSPYEEPSPARLLTASPSSLANKSPFTSNKKNELQPEEKEALDGPALYVRSITDLDPKPLKKRTPPPPEVKHVEVKEAKYKINAVENISQNVKFDKKFQQLGRETFKSEDQIPQNKENRFEITQDDETLSIALKRWSTQEGYQLVWDAVKDFPAIQTIYESSNMEEVVLKVMKDIENTDYPLHACIYKNRVLRIIPTTKVCERQKGVSFE